MLVIMLLNDSCNCTRKITMRVTRNTTRHITFMGVILREIFYTFILTSVNPMILKLLSDHCDTKTSLKSLIWVPKSKMMLTRKST